MNGCLVPSQSDIAVSHCPAGSYGWRPLVLTAGLFFFIGFVTWLNGPLISFVKVTFALSDAGAFLVPLVFYLSYLLCSLPAAFIARKTGLRNGLALALCVMGVGSAFFEQFIRLHSYPGALSGLLVIGCGLTLLQVTANPYVSLLGPYPQAAQRIAIMGLCNKFAGILAPLMIATLVMRNISAVSERLGQNIPEAERQLLISGFVNGIQLPYLLMSALLIAASLFVYFSPLPDLEETVPTPSARFHLTSRLAGGMTAIFLYVGVEVLAGDAIGTYGRGLSLPLDQTRFFTALTLASMMAGYGLGLFIVPRFLSQERCLLLSCVLGIGLAVAAFFTGGYVSVFCVALLGLANAMIMPALFPMALHGAGPHVPFASALLVMAFSGGAVTPECFVLLRPFMGLQASFTALAIFSYSVILLYGLRFSKSGP